MKCSQSPIILQRKTAIPTYERNSLVLNLSTDISKIVINNKVGNKNIVNITFATGDGGSIEFNNKEYSLNKIFFLARAQHKVSDDIPEGISATELKQIPSMDLEIILQCSHPNLSGDNTQTTDYLNVSILALKGGDQFDKTNSVFNQIFGKVTAATATATDHIISNGLNLYDILPKNRSYFTYNGHNLDDTKTNPQCAQWVIYENNIKINKDEYDNIYTKLKGRAFEVSSKTPLPDDKQLVFYKADKDSSLAGMASGDIKYVKCSRKLRNDDPDMFEKYLYNRKKKDTKCDNILQLNNNLEKQYDKILSDNKDWGSVGSMLTGQFKDDTTYEYIMQFVINLFIFLLMFVIAFLIVVTLANIITDIRKVAASGKNMVIAGKNMVVNKITGSS